MSDWVEYTLDTISEKMYSGGTPSSVKDAYYDGDIPWVRTQEVNFNYINDTAIKISELGLNNSSARWVPPNSVIIAMYGNSAGRVAFLNIKATTNQACCNFIANKEKSCPKFVFFNLLYRYKEIENMSSGAAQENLNVGLLKSLKINLPPLPTQQKIAKILSNYDDLIENNLKRIKLLEESARLTYEEWFLRFKIDGKKLDIDPESRLPFGWNFSSLDKILKFINGYAFKSKDFVTHGHPVIKIKNIDGKMVNMISTNKISTDFALKINEKFKLQEGNLLIAMTGATIGKLGFVPYSKNICYLNQRVGKIQSSYLFFAFLALNQTSALRQILNFASGAAQPNISGEQILAIKNIIPSKEILDKFNTQSEKILNQILKLTKQNQLLKEARDILLPRLMTGMIDTDDMDIAV